MRKLFLLILLCTASILAQQKVTFNSIKKEYDSFEYEKVIILSTQFLETKDTIKKGELTDIYLMKAVSHYSLNEETNAKNCFYEILRINRNYTLDPENVSPKIVTFFDAVKKDFILLVPEKEKQPEKRIEPEKKEEPVKIALLKEKVFPVDEFKTAVIKSLILPGWGHFAAGSDAKGWLLSTASVLSLGSMIYFIVRANDKEKEYLSETNVNNISSKYNTYNTAYKIRNTLIASTVAIWVYAQADFLFWDVNKFSQINFSIGKYKEQNLGMYLGMSAKISF